MSKDKFESEKNTVGAVLDHAVASYAERTALVCGESRVSFREVGERVEALARALVARGISHGDRVAVRLANCLEWVDIVFAVSKVGAVLVPINTSASEREAVELLSRSGSRLLFVESHGRGRSLAERVLEELATAVGTVAIGSDSLNGALSYDEFLVMGESVSDVVYGSRVSAAQPDDLSFLIYTSGTTGRPKGAMHTHSVVGNMRDAAERLQIDASDSVVLYLPLCHVYALFVGLICLFERGAKIVLMPKFSAATSLEMMEVERATVVFGIRTMYYDQINALTQHPRDLGSLRLCLASGPADHVRHVRQHLGRAINLYGMTECSAITTLPKLTDSDDLSADTAGQLLPSFDVRVRDDEGRVHAVGRGECEVRGPAVAQGYFEDPEATAAAYTDDGWFRTGDEVELSSLGHLRYVGRIKDSYKVGGENVDPIEVEAVIGSHPTVGLAAAIGVPDERLGEIAVVFVQEAPGHRVEPELLLEFARDRLAKYKVPHEIRIVSELPKTSTGKIQKHRLRAIIQMAERREDQSTKELR